MKNKKNIKILNIIALTFACFFLFQMEPKAILQVGEYNGASAPSGVSGGSCSGLNNVLCRYGKGFNGIRVGVVYYDATTGKYTRYGKPIDVWNRAIFNGSTVLSSSWRSLKFENVVTLEPWNMQPGYQYAVKEEIGSYEMAHGSGYANHLKNYFMTSITEITGQKQWPVIDEYLLAMGTSREALSKLGLKSEFADGDLSRSGFRLFIEPIKPYVYNNRHFVLTLTEAARMNVPISIGTAWKEENSLLFTVWDDVGIKAPNNSQIYATHNAGKAFTADPTLGLSLHIIDLSELFQDPCKYEDKNNFPVNNTTSDRKCCEYYEKNPQEVLKAKGLLGLGLTDQDALEILYQDYPTCEPQQACTFETLPTYTGEDLKKCCNTLVTETNEALNKENLSNEEKKNLTEKLIYLDEYCPFKEGAMCDPEDYTVKLNTPISCDTSTTGSVSDIDNWTCIFDSTNQDDDFEYSKFYLVESTSNNPYCSVYCREDINYEFPSNSITVDAGRHFTVNNKQSKIANWAPINFVDKRQCRTTASLTDPVHEPIYPDQGYRELYDAILDMQSYLSSKTNDDWIYYDGCNSYGHKNDRRKDCTELERLWARINAAKEKATCLGTCDYETMTFYTYTSSYSSSKDRYVLTAHKHEYTIGYNYLINNKINVEKFKSDWNYYNEKVDYHWEEWKKNKQFNDNKKCEPITYCCTECDEGGCSKVCYSGQSCKTEAFYDSNRDGDAERHSDSGRDGCHSSVPDWAGIAETHRKAYLEYKEKRKLAEDYIWSCNNWSQFNDTGLQTSVLNSDYAYSGSFDDFVEYQKFSPDLKLNYNNSEWIYHYNDNLDKKLKQEGTIVDTSYYKYAEGNVDGYTYDENTMLAEFIRTFTNKHEIEGEQYFPLGMIKYDYPINEEARAELEKSYTYKLPEHQYQYILKPQGLSVSKKPEDSETQKYIDLGYNNLPVHFMTPTGTYPITLVYWQFSENKDLVHKFDDLVFGKDRNIPLIYSCTYNVNNEIIECVDPPCDEPTPKPDPDPETCEEKCGDDAVCLQECTNCIDEVKKECNGEQDCIDQGIQDKCLTPNPNPDPDPEGPENPYDPTNPVSCALSCIGRTDVQKCIEDCSPCYGKHCNNGTDTGQWRGLTIIYRPISLEDPFPGIEGENREPGANWKDDCFKVPGTNKYECIHINENRQETSSELYFENVDPMYEFILTPAIIMNIRKYNDSNEYADFNMKCDEENWLQCKSNFLRNVGGISNWQVQIGNKAPTSWVDIDKCGMSDNWDQCNIEDEERQGTS